MPAAANLVQESSTTTGTGDFTLAAANGKRRFSDVFGTGATTDVFDYAISHQSAAEWERGTGHMSGTNTLVRDTVKESSNSGSLVSFSSGVKDVINDVPADRQQIAWQVISSDTTAVAGCGYMIDTTSGVVILTMPPSPSVGHRVAVKDVARNFHIHKATCARNSNKIEGKSEDMDVRRIGASFVLVWSGSTYGWQLTGTC